MGNRIAHLRWAVEALQAHPQIIINKVSSVYESEAHTSTAGEVQHSYLNAVVSCITPLTPHALLHVCLALEKERGRVRDRVARWSPRTLDIDVLSFDDLRINNNELKVPHPLLAYRNFVLEPWFEIAPDFRVPEPFNKTIAELLSASTDSTGIEKTSYKLLD